MSRHRTVTGQLELPKKWKWVPLGEILTNIIGGGTPSKSNPSYWQGKIPWLTIKDMRTRRPIDSIDHISEAAVKESSTNIIPADTVIIATRVGLGKVVRVPYDATINQDLKALIPKAGIDKSYLEYWIVSIADYLESIGSGTTVKGIRLETLREIPFPLAPPEAQKQIVAEIEKQFSRLDEAVASLKRIQANLKRYKAAVLKAAVEGKLTEQWRKGHPDVEPADQLLKRILTERRAKWEAEELAKMKAKGIKPKDDSWKKKYKEPAEPDTANLPELPEGWVWATYDQTGTLNLGRQRAPKYHFGPNMRQYLRVQNVFEDRIDLSDVMEMDFPPSDFEKYELKSGDMLLNEGQSPELLGRPAIYRGELPGACFTNTLIRFRAVTGVSVEFALLVSRYYMRARRFLEEGSITTNIAHLSLGRLATIEFPLPCLTEQQTIVAEAERLISVTEKIEVTIKTNLKRAERLRQTILQQAFSGGLV